MADFMDDLWTWLTVSAPSPVASGSLFYGRLPDTPVQVAALFDAGGVSQAHNPITTRGVRVQTRGATRSEGLTLANQIYDQLHAGKGSALLGVSGTDYFFHSAVCQSEPQQIGVDKNNRLLWMFDVNILAHEI
jgi:hypothetical protein